MATTLDGRATPRAEAKRAQIRDAARRLFLDHGSEGTSMDAITAAAGVSKRTLYKYYGSKEALLADIVYHITLGSRGPLPIDPNNLTFNSVADLEALLNWIGNDIVEHHRNPEFIALMRIIITETPRMPELAAQYREAVIERGFRFLVAIFDRAREAGIVKTGDSATAVRLFMGAILLATYTYGLMGPSPPRGLTREEVQDQIRLLLAAIT